MNQNKIILGTVQLGIPYGINNSSGMPSLEEAFEILDNAFHAGIDSLDTAEGYGESQKIIGKYFKLHPENKFKILTKFKINSTSVKKQFEKSSLELATDTFECFSFHNFNDINSGLAIDEILELKAKAKIKKIGVSVYGNEDFASAIDVDFIDVIQLPFNLLDNWSCRGELIENAKTRGKEIHVRSIFLQGLFQKKIDSFPIALQKLIPAIEELNLIAKALNISITQLAVKYALSFKEIDCVLVGVDSPDQIIELNSLEKNKLDQTILESITNIKVDNTLLDPRNWK